MPEAMAQSVHEVQTKVQTTVQNAIAQIPPEQWPLINTLFKITIALATVWLVLALIAWWRKRAYNLTIASTADRSKKAQPDFLKVNRDAREDAIERGEDHEDDLADRERQEATAAREAAEAAKEPLSVTQRLASIASFLMSLFTLFAALSGAVMNVGTMGTQVQKLSMAGKLKYLIYEHTFGCAVVVFVIGFHIWKYFDDKKWKGA